MIPSRRVFQRRQEYLELLLKTLTTKPQGQIAEVELILVHIQTVVNGEARRP
jgi:hypothetical protein